MRQMPYKILKKGKFQKYSDFSVSLKIKVFQDTAPCYLAEVDRHFRGLSTSSIISAIALIQWIQLAQDRDRWRALVNTAMNLRVLAPRS
jgi:hypothetical protein